MDDPAEMREAPAAVWPSPSNLLRGGSVGSGLTWEIRALQAHEADLQRSVWPSPSDPQADGHAGTGELQTPLVGGWLSLLNP